MREPDSDYKVYIELYNSFTSLAECRSDMLFCVILGAGNYLEIGSQVFFWIILTGAIGSVLLNYSDRYIDNRISSGTFIIVMIVMIVIYFNEVLSYYMLGHLMRQNLAVLLMLLLLPLNGKLAIIVSSFFHFSIGVVGLFYFALKKLPLNYGGTRFRVFFPSFLILICLLVYDFGNLVLFVDFTGIQFIDSLITVYQTGNPTLDNLWVLSSYTIILSLICSKYLNFDNRIHRDLFLLFISSILISFLFGFSDIIFYRFLNVAKLLSLPLWIIVIGIITKPNRTLKKII
jgi:hypothetical protein